MAPGESKDLTKLLNRFSAGDTAVETELFTHLYNDLHRLATSQLQRERNNHSLQPTALVNELYLEMAGRQTTWQGRAHFFAFAARVMRSVLVDHARQRLAQKRGSGAQTISLDRDDIVPAQDNFEIHIHIDLALQQLAKLDERQARIVELRYFAGLTEEEIGLILGISSRTVKRDWVMAKAWLKTSFAIPAKLTEGLFLDT